MLAAQCAVPVENQLPMDKMVNGCLHRARPWKQSLATLIKVVWMGIHLGDNLCSFLKEQIKIMDDEAYESSSNQNSASIHIHAATVLSSHTHTSTFFNLVSCASDFCFSEPQGPTSRQVTIR